MSLRILLEANDHVKGDRRREWIGATEGDNAPRVPEASGRDRSVRGLAEAAHRHPVDHDRRRGGLGPRAPRDRGQESGGSRAARGRRPEPDGAVHELSADENPLHRRAPRQPARPRPADPGARGLLAGCVHEAHPDAGGTARPRRGPHHVPGCRDPVAATGPAGEDQERSGRTSHDAPGAQVCEARARLHPPAGACLPER